VPPKSYFGFINAFKPSGPSSAAFGNWVKHCAGGTSVGHWGTLDPTACGVLVLGVGKATKLLPLLPHARKQYVFELVVGERTDTGDATGSVIATSEVAASWADGLQVAAAALVGPQTQIPPMHSAVKVGGRPLYRSARAGVEIPRAPRPTMVYALRVLPQRPGRNCARLFVECEAGTYIRVLCEELGRRLSLPARMGALLRTAAGPFRLDDAVLPCQIAADLSGCLVNPLDVLENRRTDVDASAARRFVHGNEINLSSENVAADLQVGSNAELLVTLNAILLGFGNVFARNGVVMLAPTRVLADLDEICCA
jgi:tRNA pseudouridine55 synthase